MITFVNKPRHLHTSSYNSLIPASPSCLTTRTSSWYTSSFLLIAFQLTMKRQHGRNRNDLLAHINSRTKPLDCPLVYAGYKIGRTKVRPGALPEAPCGALQQVDAVARVARQVGECCFIASNHVFLSAVDHIS